MRKGFTLIELMIVVLIVAFITVSAVSSYNLSEQRIELQTEVSKLHGLISNMRNASLNESAVDAPHVALISTVDQEAYSFIDTNDSSKYLKNNNEPYVEQIDLDLGDNDLIDVKEFYFLRNNGWTANPSFGDLSIIFEPPYAECTFALDGVVNPNFYMVKIPIFASGQLTPNRYLYLHKKSCLAEVLIQDIND